MKINKTFSEEIKQELNKKTQFLLNDKKTLKYITLKDNDMSELALITLKNNSNIYFFIDNGKLGITNDENYKTNNEKPYTLFYKENQILNNLINFYNNNNLKSLDKINPIKININKLNKICNYNIFLFLLEEKNFTNKIVSKNQIIIFHKNITNKKINKIITYNLSF